MSNLILNTISVEGKMVPVTDSREVASKIGKEHKNLLRDIKGYIDILDGSDLSSPQFFISDVYLNSQNKEQPCYQLTKQGCEMVANKMTGKKGVLFTATYVQAFNDMQEELSVKTLPKSYKDALLELVASIEKQEQLESKIKEDAPLVTLALKRLDRTGCLSVTEATKTFGLKRGQITGWAKENGYIHKIIVEVNIKGEEYFKIYDNGGYKSVGVTESGVSLINDNLDSIKTWVSKK